jgi:hypothetical protein
MAFTIRPMSFGEILDAGFTLLRDNFSLLAGISIVTAVPLSLVSASPRNHVLLALIAGLLTLLIEPIMSVALTGAVADACLDRPTSIADAYRSAWNIVTPVIGTYLLLIVLMIPALLALVVPAIYLLVCWSVIFPVMVVEHRFGMGALRRSRELIRGSWWQTAGLLIVAALIVNIPAMVLNLFWGFIPVLGPLLTAATEAIAGAYSLVVIVVYYFNRRCRLEDFDLRLLAEQIRTEGEAGTPGAPAASLS